ncbi:MAG: S-adenosylmethionine:tRNA ribosyltransferase-isomerase [Kofleriaceae bacterium]|nr:S-adenosylmethionine:tRNA ribosyltransferase-isomerase [Kofleriaceae bacterium]
MRAQAPLAARAFRRHANLAPIEEARASGGAATLRTDEVSRHAVRLVVIDRAADTLVITKFARLPELLRAGDLVVVNDAATLPGSLRARTARGEDFELRLSAPVETNRLFAVTLGAGDHRTRTEDRAAPPALAVGDTVEIGNGVGPHFAGASATNANGNGVGPHFAGTAATNGNGNGPHFTATVTAVAGRRVELVTRATGDALWQALYALGAPVQYAHRPALLPLYAVQTAYAARPWAAEMPSAGRPLTWDVLLGLRRAGVELATLTHAAGLSSTGDDALDRALPWPERYEIPRRTIDAIGRARAAGGRVIAVGTTVVRALESAAESTGGAIAAGSGTATLRLDAAYRPRVVDGLVSGLHAPGESHFDLLSAFAPRERLTRAIELAAAHGLSSHELGDSCLIL